MSKELVKASDINRKNVQSQLQNTGTVVKLQIVQHSIQTRQLTRDGEKMPCYGKRLLIFQKLNKDRQHTWRLADQRRTRFSTWTWIN